MPALEQLLETRGARGAARGTRGVPQRGGRWQAISRRLAVGAPLTDPVRVQLARGGASCDQNGRVRACGARRG